MSINLTRDSSNGRIKSNNNPMILRGSGFHVFRENNKPPRCLVKPGQELPFRVEYQNAQPCQNGSFTVEELYWADYDQLFAHMNQFNCNFLRIWLTGGTSISSSIGKPFDLTPFLRVNVNGEFKWRVFDAINGDIWNETYFQRLNSFAQKAENAGIVVQITFFNYLDLTTRFDGGDFRAWVKSPYNPELSHHPPQYPNWAKNHLVFPPNPQTEEKRQTFFLAPTNNLWKVQESIVMKTVQTLSARTNIIYEVMNEPRGTHQQAAAFSSKVVDWILKWSGPTRRPLISVNASNASGGVFDVDYWRLNQSTIPFYDKLDAISYHGLTGYPAASQTVCGGNASMPAVDPGAIQSRFNKHRSEHATKSLIYCTDAARTGFHTYPGSDGNTYETQMRDGQIFTNYPNVNSDSVQTQRAKSDLQNWAYWCFTQAVPNAGMAHIQNHSMNQITYRRIRDAYLQAGGTTLTAAEPVEAAAA